MRIEQIQGNEERRILTAMIVDEMALGRIATKWEKEMFRSRWADVIGSWCVKYHGRYGKAPGGDIQGLFDAWAQETKDKDTIALVERFLVSLDGEYRELAKQQNSEYSVDLAAKHFTSIKLRKLFEVGLAELDDGKHDKVVERVANFSRVEMGTGTSIDVLHDNLALREALDTAHEEDLVDYPGALGMFFRGQLARENFVAFMAPEKRGKSFWLIDVGWRAMLQRRRVAWFAAGDMSQRQMIRRFAIRGARHPIKSKEWPCTVRIPVAVRRGPEGTQVKFDKMVFDAPLNFKKAKAAFEDISQFKVRSDKTFLKFAAYPAGTLSWMGVEAQLRIWEREGWIPDVVIVDYADIMDLSAAAPGELNVRHQINKSWEKGRALADKFHCLVVTATQADAASYEQDIITRSNFTEDKRKLSHVTGMLGINQNKKEKDSGSFRLNWIAAREGDYSENATVCVAACLALGNPAVKSCF